MEGATKWDTSVDLSEEPGDIFPKHKADPPCPSPILSSLRSELTLAKTRIQQLEVEKYNLRKKTDSFVQKVTEEEAIWRTKTRSAITALKSELNREKKAHRRLSADLSSVNLSMKLLVQDYEKEKKDKEMMEQVCDELAREMADDKAEIESIKLDSVRLQQEVEGERKMVQMAELWREEQIQMKLADARVLLHEKYDRVSHLIQNMESFLRKGSYTTEESREAEILIRTASSVTVRSTKEFSYDPPSTAEMLSAIQHACVEPSSRADRVLATAEGGRDVGSNLSGRSSSVSVGAEVYENNGVRQSKKGALSRLWRTGQREVVNGRMSSSSTGSVEKSGVETEGAGGGWWGSPETGSVNVNRVMKGCLEWPCNAHRGSGKGKVLGIGGEMQKTQLKYVVNQKL